MPPPDPAPGPPARDRDPAGRLRRVLDRATVVALLDASAALAVAALGREVRIEVLDGDGEVVARSGRETVVGEQEARRPISVDGNSVGAVTVLVPATADQQPVFAIAETLAEVAARALSIAAAGQRFEAELAVGRTIQRSLMPRHFPELAGWEIAAAYEAAREVGGDLYDAFLLRDDRDRLAIVVADVTGKGIPAAILMADARALIHAAADHAGDPAVSLTRVNRILIAERRTSLFVTVAHAIIETRTGEMTLASAGHEPVHIVRADGSLTTLEPPGRLIGMVPDVALVPIRTILGPGDLVVAHTDGITEARGPDGSFYGEERYRALLAACAGEPAAGVVDTIVADVTAFRDGAEASDDLTLLAVRRRPEPG